MRQKADNIAPAEFDIGPTSRSQPSPKVLFVTQYALSDSTAIGVQTKLFTEQFENWAHVYWEPDRSHAAPAQSLCLENALPLLWPSTSGRGFFRRSLKAAGLNWWSNDRLRARHGRTLRAFAADADACYVAPLDAAGAARCRNIVEIVGRPFLIHLWDILDGDLRNGSADLQWLVRNATHALCVSKPLLEEARSFNARTGCLEFQRRPARDRAVAPDAATPFRIALIGHLNSYRGGLELLLDALRQLDAEGTTTEILYIGREVGLEFLPQDIRRRITCSGFLSDEDRDLALASCHAGFLPGPLESPQSDGRSRYSIPSRVLDFCAAGLPVIATVHPELATAFFLEPLSGKGAFLAEDARGIADAARLLRDVAAWRRSSEDALRFFRSRFAVSAENRQLADYFR